MACVVRSKIWVTLAINLYTPAISNSSDITRVLQHQACLHVTWTHRNFSTAN